MKLEEMPMKVWESKMIRQMLSLIQLNLGNDFQWDDFFLYDSKMKFEV